MAILTILAAGRAKRFFQSCIFDQSLIPDKSLAPINGKPNLINTLEKTDQYFDKFYIVINEKYQKIFQQTLEDYQRKIELIALPSTQSGIGSGAAVMAALSRIKYQEIILLWGDAFVSNTLIIEELINYQSAAVLSLPLCHTKDPYVSFVLNQNLNAIAVDFSKYGEVRQSGYQDQCVFKIKKSLLDYLKIFHQATFKESRYITETKEFEFLYIVHLLRNLNKPVKCFISENKDSIHSYNTVQELKAIENLMKEQNKNIKSKSHKLVTLV